MAVPKIRIKGFDAEWGKSNFGNFGSVEMCKRIFKDQTSLIGDIPFFKIGTFGLKPDAYISRELYEEYKSKYSFPNKGDILISAAGTIGRTIEYSGEDAYFQDSNIVWLNHNNKLNNAFLKYLYSIVNWSSLEGATIKRLYNSNILQTEIVIPECIEQKAIADYFQSLDSLIEATGKKIATLKQTKQASLQSMFPQEGETKPRVRFKGFTDEWECCKVKDICKHEASNISQNTLGINEGIYPIFGASGYIQNVGFYHQSQEYIGVVKDGSGVGRLGLYPAFSSILGTMHYLLPQKNTNIAFVYNILQTKNLSSLVTGSSIPHIYFKDYAEYEVFVPSLEEQKQIANYFSNLDRQISIQEQRLEKLKQIKSACLKNMFV